MYSYLRDTTLEKKRLAMLGWLVKRDLLEVRVGVMRRGEGIVHAKFGIIMDEAREAVVFSGSGNESGRGLIANYERLEISTSWEDPDRHREYSEEFAALWADRHPEVHTVTLPEALRLRLIKFAPPEPPITEPSNALQRQKAAMIWNFLVEAPYLSNGGAACDATAMVDLWPHQKNVVNGAAGAWPDGCLLCDEVGMGKTIEAMLVLRRLMAGRGVRRILILLPAGLLKQWQAELREKGGMIFPRLEGTNTLVWPDDRVEKLDGLAQALERDVLLLSRETARTENNLPIILEGAPWDLVILDESHAARRRKQEEGEFNSGTLLLNLLRQLQLRKRVRGFLLMSATPMQTHPWEPWDLLSVLGEGGAWIADFSGVRDFYGVLAAVGKGRSDLASAMKAAALIIADKQFPPLPGEAGREDSEVKLAQKIVFAPPSKRQEIERWMRCGSPLARRMHRNTRETLKRYHAMGLLSELPPKRAIQDIEFDFVDMAERRVYDRIGHYIEKRYKELEQEKSGKGFVMTVYRRRASSSPLALERSLKRRREGLLRVAERKAFDPDLLNEDIPEDLNNYDLPDEESNLKISAAFPDDPQVARNELIEVEQVLEDLQSLRGIDTKRDRFFEILQKIIEDGRAVLIFTEYTDTLEYLRENLVGHFGKSLGCFSGKGGHRWDGKAWVLVTKDAITRALQNGELRVLICTDAASEGLNLQAAGALINYDLPWNPSKVEQRIGRIDRIGQKLPDVRVVNLFLKDSVDDKVYRALRSRCGLFEHFVGAMQPVLAKARKMLLGQEKVDLSDLDAAVSQVENDPMAEEMYLESEAGQREDSSPPIRRAHMEAALSLLNSEFGPRAEKKKEGSYKLTGQGFKSAVLSSNIELLERNKAVLPLSPFEPRLRELAKSLGHAGERLPLVIGAFQKGAFRGSQAYWVSEGELTPVGSFDEIARRVEAWDGQYPDPEQWLSAERLAKETAERHVRQLEEQANQRERAGLERQISAARLRLLKELGRYLACLGEGAADLNGLFHRQMSRDIASAQRLKKCLDRLGEYPDWSSDFCRELEEYANGLSEPRCRARLLGKEIDAALEDPRWLASSVEGKLSFRDNL